MGKLSRVWLVGGLVVAGIVNLFSALPYIEAGIFLISMCMVSIAWKYVFEEN